MAHRLVRATNPRSIGAATYLPKDLVSIAWSKPTAFQAVSFERFSTRMRAWPSTGIAGTRCAISNIIWCGSPSLRSVSGAIRRTAHAQVDEVATPNRF